MMSKSEKKILGSVWRMKGEEIDFETYTFFRPEPCGMNKVLNEKPLGDNFRQLTMFQVVY